MDRYVRKYLRRYQFLRPLLLESIEHLAYCFPAATFRLAVGYDHDTSKPELVLWVGVSDMDGHQAFNHLREFDERWWLAVMDRAQGRLHFNVEFIGDEGT